MWSCDSHVIISFNPLPAGRSRLVLKSRGSGAHLSSSLSSASDTSIGSVFDETAVTMPTAEEQELRNLEESDSEESEPSFLPSVSEVWSSRSCEGRVWWCA